MWDLRSLAIRTDLFIASFDGVVEDRERYVVVRTPSNPDYWWGNFLLYPDAPDARAGGRGHEGSWIDDHVREFPDLRARVLAWDRPDGAAGEVDAFLREGYAVDEGTMLTATAAGIRTPPRVAADVEVAPLASDAHWQGAVSALTNAFGPNRSGTLEDLRVFVERQLVRYRAMQTRGVGQWFGAFIDGEVAGALGVVRQGELGRFQLVGTDPRFGRRGVCSTLVHGAARTAFDRMGVTTLVMAADATYHAAQVYESVGFTQSERLVALINKPPRA
jgi:hypothetical protein